ncbi:MAG: alpha/beta hydrolase [Chloroflexi bacterium]|nr:alpha/beta hydrolase [Chloroflexota bacterium]MCC6893751.1 alpha/beta hydrolase [Anaerolineae bacterium]
MPYIDTTTGAHLHYEEIGSGEPLILLHGLLGTARRDLGQVLDWLGESYHVYGPSLRGYGESTPKPRDFPLDFYHRDARDVLAFMDALNIQSAHILGYSDGGETALVAAGLQPQRFKSVAAIGAVGNFTPAVRPRVQSLYPGTWITDEEKVLHGIPDADAFILQWVNAMKYMIDRGGDISLGLAPNITCPVLIMLGEQDTLNPAAYAQTFLERTPNGRLEMFACGHPVHQTLWADFKRVYGDFLRAASS